MIWKGVVGVGCDRACADEGPCGMNKAGDSSRSLPLCFPYFQRDIRRK